MDEIRELLKSLCSGIPDNLPEHPGLDDSVPHAPKRPHNLTEPERALAVKNALRYFEAKHHATLASEFEKELDQYGHIYMYRFRPVNVAIKAYPVSLYPCKIIHAACMMHQIMNNLDYAIAQYPNELVTYGGNGQVFSNWIQFRLCLHYLAQLDVDQTLVMSSGHPVGLFPSSYESPRCVITNGMMVPRFSTPDEYQRLFALNVTQYGQMTAGSWCYIGPQGIVHGTTLTVLNACRRMYGGVADTAGKVFLTSGLGGMSGAQAKAATITGVVGIIAEIDESHLKKRHKQGWLDEYTSDVNELVERVRRYKQAKETRSIGYHGNVVDIWEKLVEIYKQTGEQIVDLGSDQTSCHDIKGGGYLPVDMAVKDAQALIAADPDEFLSRVQETLRRHIDAINYLSERTNLYFWDYGNAFLLEAGRAGANVFRDGSTTLYRYQSYVQDIMGDIFSLGFGPYRWIFASGTDEDLIKGDQIAIQVLEKIMDSGNIRKQR